MKARRVLEAMDLGGDPDFIDPARKRRIEQGGHPYKLSNQGMQSLSSEQYRRVIQQLARYSGMTPQQIRQNPNSVMSAFSRSMQQAMRVQEAHKEELEQAAIETVLGLDEFAAAKEEYDAGNLRIYAELSTNLDTEGMRPEPEEPGEEWQQQLNIPQIAAELDAERMKRRFTNLMIQGSAINKNYAFHMAADRLNAIHPDMLKWCGMIAAGGEFMYWTVSDEMRRMAHRSGAGLGGRVHVRVGEDGVTEIHAKSIVYPILIHEVTKGLMEYLSHAPDDDDETRRYVRGQEDTLDNEVWDINTGAGLWRRFTALITDQKLIPYVYDQIVRMPASEVQEIMQGLADNDARTAQKIRGIEARLRGELGESASGLVSAVTG